MRKINIVIGIVFILFCAFIITVSNSFSQTLIVDTGLGADFFPKLVSTITIVLALLLIWLSIKDKNISSDSKSIFNNSMKKPFLGMALILSYVICINIIGYLVSTIAFCFIFLHIFKVKKMLTKILVSVIFSFVIYFIFSNLFLINLPQGFLI